MKRWMLNRWRERFYRGPRQSDLTCALPFTMGDACPECWRPSGWGTDCAWCAAYQDSEDSTHEASSSRRMAALGFSGKSRDGKGWVG